MQLLTVTQRKLMLDNGRKSAEGQTIDPVPLVKLFTPDGNCTWLLTEIDPRNQDIAFGLCDLGLGFPELGVVSLAELMRIRGHLGLPVERDRHFVGDQPLSAYAKIARQAERIVA